MFSLKKTALVLIIIISGLMAFLTCQMDHGLEPIRSGISGTINYIGNWPANTAEVRIVAATIFPPSDLNDLIIGDILPVGGDSTIYTFYLDPGDYYLGLVWRERDAAWGIQSIFGIYTESGESFSPGRITVPDNKTVVTGKNIIADFSYAQKATNSSIAGTITFIGNWPDNSENVMVIATSKFPPESLLDLNFSGLIPPNIDSSSYLIPLPPGTYSAVGAVLKIENQPWALDNIIGLLLEGSPPTLKQVTVSDENSQVEGIDLTVYFRGK